MRTALALALWLGLAATPALAAKVANVETDEVEVRDGPHAGGKVVDKLKKGDAIAVSNVPINGFYKVRTGLGIVGFVDAGALALAAPAAPSGGEPTLPGDAPVPPPESRDGRPRKDRGFPYNARLKAFGGYNFFSVKDVNTLLSSEVLKFGWSAGAEAQVFISPLFTLTGRAERIQSGVFARDSAQSHVYQIDTGAWTVLGGLEVTVASTSKVSVHVGALGGAGLNSTISATDLSSAAPNVTTMSSMALAFMGKLDVHVQATGALGFFIEGGYRYQKSPAMQPAGAAADGPNGSQIFKDQTTQTYVPVTLDYSGPFAGAGLSVSF